MFQYMLYTIILISGGGAVSDEINFVNQQKAGSKDNKHRYCVHLAPYANHATLLLHK